MLGFEGKFAYPTTQISESSNLSEMDDVLHRKKGRNRKEKTYACKEICMQRAHVDVVFSSEGQLLGDFSNQEIITVIQLAQLNATLASGKRKRGKQMRALIKFKPMKISFNYFQWGKS